VTDLDLEAIKARAEAAGPGPWYSAPDLPPRSHLHAVCRGAGASTDGLIVGTTMSAAEADFIAHAREDVPALAAEVARLREALERIASHGPGDVLFGTPPGAIARTALHPEENGGG
jgi:hypothetical protein